MGVFWGCLGVFAGGGGYFGGYFAGRGYGVVVVGCHGAVVPMVDQVEALLNDARLRHLEAVDAETLGVVEKDLKGVFCCCNLQCPRVPTMGE